VNKIGFAGKVARFFINSKLTPLIILTCLLLGLFAVVNTPREEEPQILVPMVDIYLPYPGAGSKEVEERVTTPIEKYISEIPGVEYVYSVTRPGMSMLIVRFLVGQDPEKSLVKVYDKLNANMDKVPPGVLAPLVKLKSIDDVPIMSLTLWSDKIDGASLRKIAFELDDQLKQIDNVANTQVIGGQRRQFKILLNPDQLTIYNLSPLSVVQKLHESNVELPSGNMVSSNEEFRINSGGFIKNIDELKSLVIGVHNNNPIYLNDVASVEDDVEEPLNYVFLGIGPAGSEKNVQTKFEGGTYPAVTISIAKRKGSNATTVAENVIHKIENLKSELIPSEVNITITRNYGETAQEKSNELLYHMLIATVSVIILMALALGWRDSLVVAVAIPVTLALTLFLYYLMGYTLNRVTLFALIFSIGILVDDAIVVVENIHRYFSSKIGLTPMDTAVSAVDEVGNPNILATFTVIAAILPMAFVSGLMGPYMMPIPIGASLAMLFSLFIAFIISPYLSFRMLGETNHKNASPDDKLAHTKTWDYQIYVKFMTPLIKVPIIRWFFLSSVILLLVLAISLVYFKVVRVKMLPFDNKSEFQIVIDMPEGTTLEDTYRVTHEIGSYLETVPEVTDFQGYVGTSAPFNFNGLVRHYFLRSESYQSDLQVNLQSKHSRNTQSHDIAKRIRPEVVSIGAKYGARIKVVEIPPGPPVMQTLVAEIYGPDMDRQRDVAKHIRSVFEKTESVVDVDWDVEDDQSKMLFKVDKEKAAINGISTEAIARTLNVALNGYMAGLPMLPDEKEPVSLMVRVPVGERSDIMSLKSIRVQNASGQLIPLSELVSVESGIEDKSIYHKNMKRVVYVTGDVAGREESPAYAIQKMSKEIQSINIPEGYQIEEYYAHAPFMEDKLAMKWDGEMQITIEVFRDLGIAFGIVLILIYILVVAWFQSFTTPLVIMAPIPLTLIGILPGHALFGAFFTATSMIGMIALAGIIVRNSIILIDFVEIRRRDGWKLEDAIIDAGAVRFRPMLLTASAVVVGSFVMLFDPIFQGLAIALMFGEVASTLLSRVTIPILYYLAERNRQKSHNISLVSRIRENMIRRLKKEDAVESHQNDAICGKEINSEGKGSEE